MVHAYDTFEQSAFSGFTCENIHGEKKPYEEALWDTIEKFSFNYFRYTHAKIFYVKLITSIFDLMGSFPYPEDERDEAQLAAIDKIRMFGLNHTETMLSLTVRSPEHENGFW